MNQRGVYDYARRGPDLGDDSDFWDFISDDQTGFPILTYLILIGAVLSLALVIGFVCRFSKRRKNRRTVKDGDFSVSEEERRASIVKKNVIEDMKRRDDSLSLRSGPSHPLGGNPFN